MAAHANFLYDFINCLKEAAELVELAYNDYANQGQRAALVEEFYGPSFALFKVTYRKVNAKKTKKRPVHTGTLNVNAAVYKWFNLRYVLISVGRGKNFGPNNEIPSRQTGFHS